MRTDRQFVIQGAGRFSSIREPMLGTVKGAEPAGLPLFRSDLRLPLFLLSPEDEEVEQLPPRLMIEPDVHRGDLNTRPNGGSVLYTEFHRKSLSALGRDDSGQGWGISVDSEWGLEGDLVSLR